MSYSPYTYIPTTLHYYPTRTRNSHFIQPNIELNRTIVPVNNYSPYLRGLFSIINNNSYSSISEHLNRISFNEGNKYRISITNSGYFNWSVIKESDTTTVGIYPLPNALSRFNLAIINFLNAHDRIQLNRYSNVTSILIEERKCTYYINIIARELQFEVYFNDYEVIGIAEISRNFSSQGEQLYSEINNQSDTFLNNVSNEKFLQESFFKNPENIMNNSIETQIKRAIEILKNNDSMKTIFKNSIWRNKTEITKLRDIESEDTRKSICNDIIRRQIDALVIIEELFDLEESYRYGITPYEAAQLVTCYENYSSDLLHLALKESIDSCIDGKIVRIINSLSGVHPNINIILSPQEHANELAIVYRKKNAPIHELIERLKEEKIPKEIIDIIAEHY